MAFPIKTFVEIGGIDVTQFILEWDNTNTNESMIDQINLLFHSQVSTLQPLLPDNAVGLEIKVKRGPVTGQEEFVFRGFIAGIEKQANKIAILARDKLYNAVQANVTKTFASNVDTEAGKISEIFKTLINNFTDLTADNTSVTDSGTAVLLERYICNNADVYERCEVLGEFLTWQLYYRPDTDLVYFEPWGARTSIGTITVGNEIVDIPKWVRDGTKKVKILKVFGGPQEVETTEFFSGDTVKTEFTLQLLPVSVKVFVDGVLKTGGVEGATAGADYFVDPTTKAITFVVAPPSGASNVEIRYSYLSPIAVTGQNLIDYGLDLTLRKPELTTLIDVQNYLVAYLLRHSVDFIKATLLVTNVVGLDPGQTITVVDTAQNINQLFFIKKVKKKFPYTHDEVEVDSEEIRTEDWEITTEDRIRRIEERLIQQESLVFIIRNLEREIVPIGRRYFIGQRRDILSGDKFVLGSAVKGILGTDKLGDSPVPFGNFSIQQGENKYEENFHDNDFKDLSTTADWNNSNKELNFTASQVGLSLAFDFKNPLGIVTTATLTAIEDSGSFTYEMAANGSTFETVTNGLAHVFSTTGTDLRWRITENAASTGKITGITVENYH